VQQDRIRATFFLLCNMSNFVLLLQAAKRPGNSSTANPHALIEIVVAGVLVRAH
jgi:hypothetical protein